MANINYSRSGDKVEIIIRDSSEGKIETLHCQVGDKKKYASILRYLKEKYGFEPEVSVANPKEENELDWWD